MSNQGPTSLPDPVQSSLSPTSLLGHCSHSIGEERVLLTCLVPHNKAACKNMRQSALLSVVQVEVPEELQTQLKAAMQDAQIPVPDSSDRWNMALEALKVCWLLTSVCAAGAGSACACDLPSNSCPDVHWHCQLRVWLGTVKHLYQEAGVILLNLLASSSKRQFIRHTEPQLIATQIQGSADSPFVGCAGRVGLKVQ